ncbi:hypothetical protein PLIIFM63780_007386 [Purpureocillium lilacinum]|uniref:C2H2-type domain-containing protein n=1 Tax=Purpureocillium lilacinum TaxID=33203 RepID=A0A2U3DTJ5_PURLI|nr:hypothetical protein PCL_06991 [Purpureocillium lilacinum]GJN83835.1 hypothetical protein PLIIFM63780_007386 [Purpureocillium lilacinum]
MSISSAAVAVEARPPRQPFQCLVCQSRFTRHENLKRHAALHSRSRDATALPCELCSATFSRSDLLHRHMKRKHHHLEHEDKRRRVRRCDSTGGAGVSPRGGKGRSPSLGDTRQSWNLSNFGLDSTDGESAANIMVRDMDLWSGESQSLPFGFDGGTDTPNHSRSSKTNSHLDQTPTSDRTGSRPLAHALADLGPPDAQFLEPDAQLLSMMTSSSASFNTNMQSLGFNSPSSIELPPIQDDWSPTEPQIARGCHLFFTHISPFMPFLHQPTFDASQVASHLLLSMLCLAYQYDEDPDCDEKEGSGACLSERCYLRARTQVALNEESAPPDSVSLVQAYLLLQVYAMMYLCGDDSSYALRAHSKMIALARDGGLMHPTPAAASSATRDLDSLWRSFARAESHKRTLFAAHQVDTLWYQFLSIPRQLSHLEIKHELPCPEEYWAAASATEWAHQQLVAEKPGCASLRYPDAIRRFISPNADLDTIPAFDAYGAVNITHFLVSSAQEISGWCTMTGMLSIERLEPLRASLLALSPFIRRPKPPPPPTTDDMDAKGEEWQSTSARFCEGAWEAAMIDVQMWSPSHTGGIVGKSMDAVLHQLTYLAPSCEFLCGSDTAEAIQPHVDWFLAYLDAEPVPRAEAPWMTVYAYKAFMIAWQLVSGGVPGAMRVVGVQDGDLEGALAWAREVFGRRRRWQIGRIIMDCLDTLAV